MGRFRTGLKEGPWSPEEDENLINFIQKHGHENWRILAKLAGLKRCGNSCKSRWLNHLRFDIDIKKRKLSEAEEQTIVNPHSKSSKFSQEEEQTILENQTENDEIKNFNSSGKGKRVLSPLPSQGESQYLQGRTSTQSADVVSENVMDFTNEFTDGKLFESREALIEWIHKVGRKNGFKIVILRSDSGRITFCCERSGQYRNTKKKEEEKKEKQLRNISTKKCGCPFELQYQKLDGCDNWKLKVVHGVHNHSIVKDLGGRSYAKSLSKEEILFIIEMSKRNVRPKDILVELKNRDVNNVAKMKDIYNALRRLKVKKMAESSNNTHSSNPFVNSFPIGLQPYIHHIKNVTADGNCGFRVIAKLMGFGENGWLQVREDLLKELTLNLKDYRQLYGSEERVEEMIHALSHFENRPADYDKWMIMPDMGHLVSSAYNVILLHLSLRQCLTFLPLRSVPTLSDSHKTIAIGFVNNNHFVEVFLVPDHPIPPIASHWYKFRHPRAIGWDTIYIPCIEHFREIISDDVATNEVIEIDSDSFGDKSVHANAAMPIRSGFFRDYMMIRRVNNKPPNAGSLFLWETNKKLSVFVGISDMSIGFYYGVQKFVFTSEMIMFVFGISFYRLNFFLKALLDRKGLRGSEFDQLLSRGWDLLGKSLREHYMNIVKEHWLSIVKGDRLYNFVRSMHNVQNFVYTKRSLQAMALDNSEETVESIIFDCSFNHVQEFSLGMLFSFRLILEAQKLSTSEKTSDFDIEKIQDACTFTHHDWSFHQKRAYVLGIVYSLQQILLVAGLSKSKAKVSHTIPGFSLDKQWAFVSGVISFCQLIFQAMGMGKLEETPGFDSDFDFDFGFDFNSDLDLDLDLDFQF